MKRLLILFRYPFFKGLMAVGIILFLYFLALMAAFLHALTHY